jgi:hypothetical protein
MQGIEVIDVSKLVNGQSYQSYCEKWMQWFVSNNAESRNYGSVYYLHGLAPTDQEDPGNYTNIPVTRIGSQAMNISEGEYIFLPVLNAFSETIDTGVPDDPNSLLNYVKMELAGTCPHHEQATITNGAAGNTENLVEDLSKYLVITDVFSLYVPPIQQGAKQLRTSIDIPIVTEGYRNCIMGGWILIIKFTQAGKYYIHTYANGRGQYRTGMLYEINVSGGGPAVPLNKQPVARQADWTKSAILDLAQKKRGTDEIGDADLNAIRQALR